MTDTGMETPPQGEGGGSAMKDIVAYLQTKHSFAQTGDIGPDTQLLESGLLDSIGMLELMTFIGETMEIEISDDDFVPEHFQTVGSLVSFVEQKQRA